MGKILNAIKEWDIESMIKIKDQLSIIGIWYLTYSFYPMFWVDNEVVNYIVFITLTLLTLLWIVLYILVRIRYKGSLMELMQRRTGWLDNINTSLWIAVGVYQGLFCPKAYYIYVSYGALTIMVINMVIMILWKKI